MKPLCYLLMVFLAFVVFFSAIPQVNAQVPYLDVSIGPYDTDFFVGDNITISISVGIVGITGDVEIEINPVLGLGCSECIQNHNFTMDGEVFVTEFVLSADQAGFYSQSFSVTATLLSDTSIFDTKSGQDPILVRSPFIDVSIGPYSSEVFINDEFVIDISIGIVGIAGGEVFTEINPALGLSCTVCNESFNFTQEGDVRITNFTLTADIEGFYPTPFSVTSTLVSDPSIFGTRSGTALTVRQPFCEIDVFGLDVIDGVISVNIKNTGEVSEEIQNIVSVDGADVRIDNFILNAGETNNIVFSHSFSEGTHAIENLAEAGCGAIDSETIMHIVLAEFVCQNPPGIEGQNRCDFNLHQFLVCSISDWLVLGQNDAAYCNNCAFGTCGDGILNCGETADTCPLDAPDGEVVPEDVFCSVRITRLDETSFITDFVETHVIEVGVKNTGDAKETITLDVFLDGISEEQLEFDIQENDVRREIFYFSHLIHGEHSVEVEVEADCGSQDSDFVIFFASDPLFEFEASRICGVSIEEFGFLRQFNEDQTGFVEFSIKNTGNTDEVIDIDLLLDGEALGTDSVVIPHDQTFSGDFFYETYSGAHLLTLDALADCGAHDRVIGSITVNQIVIPQPFPPEPPTIEEILNTSVTVKPLSFDVEIYTSKVLVVDIVSSENQEFSIDVTGIPQDWLNYKSNVFVPRGGKTTFIHINPKEFGRYSITVSVTALSEENDFETVLDMFVAIPTENEEGDDFTGFIVSFISTNFLSVIIGLIIIVSIIMGYAGYRRLKLEDDFLANPPLPLRRK